MLLSGQISRRGARHVCTGLTLVELLVSMTLGLLLSAAMISIYLESKSHYLAEQAAARLQENGRFALEILGRELALAGFYGGDLSVVDMAPATINTDCPKSGQWALDSAAPVDVIDNLDASLLSVQGATFDNCLTLSGIQAGTDLIAVKRTAVQPTLSNGEFPDGVASAGDKQWYLRLGDYGKSHSWVFIPEDADFPGADTVPGSRVDYWEVRAKVFYIRKYSSVSGDAVPTLCVEKLTASAMATRCLVEGVEDMQLEIGVDSDGDGVPDRYQPATTGTDLGNAVTARLYLLLRSIRPITGYTNSKAYTLGQAAPKIFNDAFSRRVFSQTVRLNNVIRPLG